MKNVLIIGAQGMLGRPVARRLVQDGFRVRAMARRPAAAQILLPKEVEVLWGDLANPGSIDAALQGMDAVYVSVDSRPGEKFHSETDGLRNVIAAAKNHGTPRLLVLSALLSSHPLAAAHPWWHFREKYEAQQIAKASSLPWTLFEPTWFMESIPLFVKKKVFSLLAGKRLAPYWVSGDDYGRIVSAALSKNVGVEETVPVQGPEAISLGQAARRFIQAYDPVIRILRVPFWVLRGFGMLNAQARELVNLLDVYDQVTEPAPNPAVWERFARPELTIETYAAYSRRTGDFPQK
jgi:uncharacterized protein YbjT (DUF2867 family)